MSARSNILSKKINWEQLYAAEQPIFKPYGQMESLETLHKIVGNNASAAIVYGSKGFIRWYYPISELGRIREDGKRLLDKESTKELIEDIKETVRSFWEISAQMRSYLRTGSIHDAAFIELFSNWEEILYYVFAYFRTTQEHPAFYAIKKMQEIIAEHFPSEDEQAEIFIDLVTPTEPDITIRERTDWIAVIQNSTDERIKEHLLKYSYLVTNIDSEDAALQVIKKLAATGSYNELKSQTEETKKRLIDLKERQQKLFTKIDSKQLEFLANLIQNFAFLRFDLKVCWAGVHYYLFPLFSTISQSTGLPIRDIMMFWTTKEMKTFFNTREFPKEQEMRKRDEFYFLQLKNKHIEFNSGPAARELKDSVLGTFDNSANELKGNVACRGVVEGRVQVINFDDLRLIRETAERAREPFVLVAGMTNPNMTPLFKKALAIITDEGGMTCHAAIISRELNIPCIVGTRSATQLLKDNDLVHVDAEKGLVKILNRES